MTEGLPGEGIVLWYNQTRGYGFITPDQPLPHGKPLFVHATVVRKAGLVWLTEGQRVSFVAGDNEGRPCALRVRVGMPAT